MYQKKSQVKTGIDKLGINKNQEHRQNELNSFDNVPTDLNHSLNQN